MASKLLFFRLPFVSFCLYSSALHLLRHLLPPFHGCDFDSVFDYESLAHPVISFRCSTAISIPAGDFDSVFDCDSFPIPRW